MRLLVACPHLLFLLDTRTREYSIVDAARGGYYGISWTPDGRELALGHSGLEHDFGDSLEEYMDSERGYLSLGGRRGVEGLAAPHQLLCTDDHVLVANTGRNCLTAVRRDDLFYRHVWVEDARWDRKGKERLIGKHFNSVHLAPGGRLLMLAHGFRSGSSIAELTYPGLEFVRWIETKAYQAHNLWALPGGEVLTCNTMQGSVIEAASGRVVWKVEGMHKMTRGLACAGKYVFVGMSEFARRGGRTETDGGVWVLDRETWREVDFLPLPMAGNVHEVRVVDEPDECHHGHVLKAVPAADGEATASFRAKVAARAAKPRAAADLWTAYVGDPVFRGSEVECGPGGGLTLAACAGPAARDVSVSARIDAGPGHAGLIARYRGTGDLNMVCALIEVGEARPHASLWENDGTQWKQLARVRVRALPATLRFEAVGPRLTLLIDGRKVVEARTTVLEPGRVGVRGLTGRYNGFQAATVSPGGAMAALFPPPAAKAA